MPNTLDYYNTKNLKNKIMIDVRSPYEFKESTIPGSINIPVLLDEERKKVGTLYVNKKIDEAKQFAVNSISKRLPEIFSKFLDISKNYENIIIFCARGGYRSKSLSIFLNSLDISNFRIEGGYKSYRNYVLNNMDNVISTITPIVLYGNTGCGKTKILSELKNKNLPVIDLEGLAVHRGSILGAVGLNEQPTQKMFENLLFEELSLFKNGYVFLEGESKRIGKIILPELLYQKMASSINIKIDAPIEYRIENLVEEYASPKNKESIAEAIKRMNKFISNETVKKLLDALNNNDFAYIAKELCINYYDKRYKNRIENYDYEFTNYDLEKVTNEIIAKTKKYF
ncbi:tRNA 2-selenouridine(34) synthase MnmH [Miniphocaeibacter massiliensis]|uniref:tRNA 2-selenouridine(34) synthase MnmH n=1 Tax=Miniphocaeibacter massiliensis TaxID=2041841 RepID=UPI0013EDF0D6|nr:tRNA 2-selenouridine(34) synthase MnmH [Miniphocaeibacter massiliensis]